ncbi:MAG: hypothetical protein IKQ67_07230 [Candidatus Methanomethylophilaceae archaeon]|nr:hypothetical protein [Candidatus Methanomethylophilaceae archaeon]
MKRISKIVVGPELDLSPLDDYVGKSCSRIDSELDLGVSRSSKTFAKTVIDRMVRSLGIELDPVRYQLKMVRVDEYGVPKNPTSLKVTDYHTIILEEWESSEFKQLLKPTYVFLVVTHGPPDSSVFKGYVIHDFTEDELESAKAVWTDTRDKIRDGVYDRFLSDKDTGTFFFKCHAANVSCQMDAPKIGKQIPRSFWISRKLLRKIVSDLY